jgi:hypothetical protein
VKSRELQRLHDEHLAKVDEREKDLQSRLHEAIKTLRGEYLLFIVLSENIFCLEIL